MLRVKTYTRTTAKEEPEDINIDDSSLMPPTKEEIIAQLESHFAEHPNDVVTTEDILKIADDAGKAFEYLRDKPYGSFAKYSPTKPRMTIKIYPNEYLMFDRERYPGDYSAIKMNTIKCSQIDFQMTVVYSTKWVSLAYVSKNYWF